MPTEADMRQWDTRRTAAELAQQTPYRYAGVITALIYIGDQIGQLASAIAERNEP